MLQYCLCDEPRGLADASRLKQRHTEETQPAGFAGCRMRLLWRRNHLLAIVLSQKGVQTCLQVCAPFFFLQK